jgi:chromate transporter
MPNKKYLQLFLIFFKVGSLAFGGPFVIIEYLRKELVAKHRLLSEEEFSTALGVGFTTPGPVAFGSGVYLGYMIEGITGALIAAFGLLLTPFTLALLFAVIYSRLKGVEAFSHISMGLAAGAVGILASLCLRQTRGNIRSPFAAAVVLLSACILLLGFNPIFAIAVGCGIGLLKAAVEKRKLDGDKVGMDKVGMQG